MTGHTERSHGKIGAAAIAYLGDRGHEVSLRAGEPAVRRGEPGQTFFVVLDGEVEVRLSSGEGRHLHLTRLGPGDSFGEMAILRQEPVSADVVALGSVTLLAYPAAHLATALAECEPLRTAMLTRLANDLERTSSEAWRFFQRAEALRLLVRTRATPEPLVTSSARARAVEREIGRLAGLAQPVLLTGEAGTGKLLAAQLLHQAGPDAAGPLIVVDCQRLEPVDAARLLFGAEPGSEAVAGLIRLGAFHLAQGGSLVLRWVDSLTTEVQDQVAAAAEADQRTRLLATIRDEPGGGDTAARLTPRLAACFGDRQLTMPRLVDRPRDILPLARLFLAEAHEQEPVQLSRDAEHALVSLRYRHRNVAELRETVATAAICAEGGEIRAEHIFSGPRSGEQQLGFDLSRLPLLAKLRQRRLVPGRLLSATRLLIAGGFVAAIVLCLTAADSTAGRTANSLIWGCWEPVVFALFLLVGRLWCTVCPLSATATLVQRLACLGHPPPAWMKKAGIWLAIAGFFLIVWSERAFHMTRRPVASGLLLLSLLAGAVLCCLIYRREVWCRHLCPLGTLAGALAPPAPLSLAANPWVCASSCTSHACYRGSATVAGCPVFHHPLYAHQAHLCKLCLDCLQSCPHGSVRLLLRPPLQAVWRLRDTASSLAPFAGALLTLALVMLAVAQLGWPGDALTLAGLGLGAALLGAFAALRLPNLLLARSENDTAVAWQVAFALLVLAWGPLMADQLSNLPGLDAVHLTVAAETIPQVLTTDLQLSLRRLFQGGVIGGAGLAALLTLSRIRAGAAARGISCSAGGWRLLLCLCLAYAAVALLML